MTEDWPFDDAKNVACFTTRQVLGGATITFVSHDADDGAWQFISSDGAKMKDMRIVALSEVYKQHPAIGKLAMLPPGWEATRDSAEEEWEWSEASPEDDNGSDEDDEEDGEAWKQA
ncbi:MAG: hypothetical protein ACAI35_22075 [Candidatus Methylacidiphilales bacterium]|nr:hypothetical protein [Candidatus Methylacidiphilales bacterium]